jgi:eukaryotic-like serine/threonine-protein kinase
MQDFGKSPKETESSRVARLYEFGPFCLNPLKRIVLLDGEPLPLTPKCFDILLVLVEHAGEVLVKEELMELVWPDTVVEEGNLNRNISTLRKALGESPNDHRYIVTVPGRGYRFVAEVREIAGENASRPRLELRAGSAKQALELAPKTLARRTPLRSITRLVWIAGTVAVFSLALVVLFKLEFQAKPALNANDQILIADFTNATGDPVFNDTMKQAISVQLAQSPFLNILSDSSIRSTLKLMTKPSDTRLTADVALDLCQRAGCKAYVTGSIAPLGSEYVIGLTAVNCHTGNTVARQQVTAKSKELVLPAFGEAAAQLRKQLGESLVTVQKFDTPLEATTPSLDALEAYSLGSEKDKINDASAIPFFKRAIELDPHFASAYEGLGVCYYNMDQPGLARENFAKAYQLSGHASEREKFTIAARYYNYVTGDLEKAIETYQLWEQAYPRDMASHANLGGLYGAVGQYEKGIAETLEAMRLNPSSGAHYSNLVLCYSALDRFEDAKRIYEQAVSLKIEDPTLKVNRFGVAFVEGDTAEMNQLLAWSTGKPEGEDNFLAAKSDTEAYFGHAASARDFSRRAVESALRNFQKETAAQWQMDEALHEAEFGDLELARRDTASALALADNHDTRILAALAIARAGETARAETMADELAKQYPLDTFVNSYWVPVIRASAEIERKDGMKAVEILSIAAPYEFASPDTWPGLGGPLYPAYLRGLAYLLLHQGSDAAVEFRKLVDHRGFMRACPLRALAYIGLGRAYTLVGDIPEARSAYQQFFTLWNNADANIRILRTAKSEYAKLR